METPNRYRSWFIGLSLGVVLAFCIWPGTSWLIRTQLTLASPARGAQAPWKYFNSFFDSNSVKDPRARGEFAETHKMATHHPKDYRLQLADALTYPPDKEQLSSLVKIERLRTLAKQFPDRPSVYANILRFAAQGQVSVHRTELMMFAKYPTPYIEPSLTNERLEQLAAYDHDAAEGERLDPDNAYFPFMRAMGFFSGHRDDEALAALRRAAAKSQWNEYYDDELLGEWQLIDGAYGQNGALLRTAFAGAILFPQYAQMRGAARVAIAKAIEAEKAGRLEEGHAIRNTVRQCGSLLRVQARSIIGNLVGIAIVKVAMTRPEGAPLISETDPDKEDKYREHLLRDYDAYLQRVGHSEESATIHGEMKADAQIHALITQSLEHGRFGMELPKLVVWWVVDLILLSCAFWMLVLGGAGALLGRHSRIRNGQGMPSYARSGVAFGLMAAILIGIALLLGVHLFQEGIAAQLYLAGALLLGGVSVILSGKSRADRLRGAGIFGLSFTGFLLLGIVGVLQARGFIETCTQCLELFTTDPGASQQIALWPVGLIFTVPILTVLTLGVLSLIWRVPLSVGLIRGFRGTAVPIACVLLLIYCALLPFTLRQEGVVDTGLKRTMQHEGHYYSELTGTEWPGAIP